MDLRNAARYFDRAALTDAYTDASVGLAQFDLFDDSKRDGMTGMRRVISCDRDVVMPARGVVKSMGQAYIVGDRHDDQFNSYVIRAKYVVQVADGQATCGPIAHILGIASAREFYYSRFWIKDMRLIEAGSTLTDFMGIVAHVSEAGYLKVGGAVMAGGDVHIIRNVLHTAGGFLLAETALVGGSAEYGLFAATLRCRGTYDPVADQRQPVAPTVTNALCVRFQDAYAYQGQKSERYKPGDLRAYIPVAAAPAVKAGDSLEMPSGAWEVLHAEAADTWSLHLRRL